ncbi:hypothetical protein [Snuella sedimenti]|uniref:Outer membrane beta-barrel porin/alpha-amylase n=1 Tax=Snuella sedimenti TaxID=2798802 RepID=A0A8J7LTV9_9FLAO|nr:hypothetical protein [Snuella sedimenti]MBJ6368811.1 hypothetical protein [Snuella sedimenti]
MSKRHFFILLLVFTSLFSFSQDAETAFEDTKTKLYLETNIDFASSTEDSRPDAQAGTGTLGIKFLRKFVYGKIRFTVFSKNDNINSENADDSKIFGSNLLIPSNSSSNISNFNFMLGTKSFAKPDDVEVNEDLLSFKRFGGYINFSVHNTEWKKEDLMTPVTTKSLDLHLTYRLLSLDIEGDNGRADLYLIAGLSSRKLAGDYGLSENEEIRKEFIGTDKLGFTGSNFGARLELNNFFGQINMTNFGKDNIAGFSGNQTVISVGFNAGLNLSAKESSNDVMIKAQQLLDEFTLQQKRQEALEKEKK